MSLSQYAMDPTRPESSEERQRAMHMAARPLADAIEAVADWLGTVWDFDPDAVDDHDLATMRAVLAWIEMMPGELRAACLMHVKWERAEFRGRYPDADQRPLMLMGVTMQGRNV